MIKVERTARIVGLFIGVVFIANAGLEPQARAVEMDYPEFSIVPRYSDRLEAEAKAEPLKKWGAVAALATPFAASMAVGASLFNPRMAMAYWTPFGIGTVGLVGVGLFGAFLQPYANGLAIVAPLKNGTLREKLYRERVAEEQIEATARMGNRLRWFSAILNLTANGFTIANYVGTPDADVGAGVKPLGIVVGGVGALIALTPLIFRPYWIDVADEQASYRKRIFAPVASVTLFPVGTGYVPGVLVGAQF